MIRGGYQTGENCDLADDVHPNNVRMGDRVRIRPQTILFGSPKHLLEIGNDVYVNARCWFHGSAAKLTIGSNVSFGPEVKIFTDSGPNACTLLHSVFRLKEGPVTIEDQVWVGVGAIIMPGVTIGHGSVVGAMSLVKADVPPHTIVAGNPAQSIMHTLSERVRSAFEAHRKICNVCSVH
jgi:galactoside O-acetyltransferase